MNIKTGATDLLKGFRQFILRGNVVDLAIGVVIGASFNTVVSSLVKDFLTPLVAAIFKVPDFSKMAFTINGSQFMYGDLINSLISFLLVAVAVYFCVVLPMNAVISRMHKQPPADPSTKRCPECLTEIPIKATRCAACGIKLEDHKEVGSKLGLSEAA